MKGTSTGKARAKRMLGNCYAAGGKVHSDKSDDMSMVKAAVHKHEGNMHPGEPVTKLMDGGYVSDKKPAMRMDRMSRGGKLMRGGAGGGLGRLEKAGM